MLLTPLGWCLSCLGLAAAAGALTRWQAARHRREVALADLEHRRALQEQQEEFHRQFQARQQALFNSMSEGVLLLDRQGRVRMINDSLRKILRGHGRRARPDHPGGLSLA